MKNRQMIIGSLFISLAVVLGFVESMIPTPLLIAGAKLGLANIITVSTIKLLNRKQALVILLVRVVLSASLFSGFSGFLYSITGGLLAFLGMSLMIDLKLKDVTLVGVSVVGATLHNLGQVLVASILFSNLAIMSYLPMLMMTGIITGIFIGLIANVITVRLQHANIF